MHLSQVDSTSAYLKRLIRAGTLTSNTLCITDHQTHGYGQRERSWQHDHGNLAISYAVVLNSPVSGMMSAQVALLLQKSLTAFSTDKIRLKWPNDLFNRSGKVAGILLEVARNSSTNQTFLVIGIGINLVTVPSLVDKNYPVGQVEQLDRDLFLSEFSQALYEHFSDATALGSFSGEEWSLYDYFYPNQPVIVYDTDHSIEARYIGVNDQAELVLQAGNDLLTYQSSRVSIRAN
ncbi:biotin--[acetyl-CoA-carboxylase] ligase [Hydrogenovibrio sp. SC-1]|nr:biotin--[acetyl-CoA-carboxylase] ligase [Hydrogenovibrio sp. SC-1]